MAANMGPELPIGLGTEQLQFDGAPAESDEGFYQSHRGKKSAARDYKDPTNIPRAEGFGRYGVQ